MDLVSTFLFATEFLSLTISLPVHFSIVVGFVNDIEGPV
jgi:hypothetical protein